MFLYDKTRATEDIGWKVNRRSRLTVTLVYEWLPSTRRSKIDVAVPFAPILRKHGITLFQDIASRFANDLTSLRFFFILLKLGHDPR